LEANRLDKILLFHRLGFVHVVVTSVDRNDLALEHEAQTRELAVPALVGAPPVAKHYQAP
jgi:lipoate synthase